MMYERLGRKHALIASAILHTVTSHTWIDCFGLDPKELYDYSELYIYQGNLTKTHCDGFIIDYVDRGHPDCGVLNTHKILKKDAEKGAKVCTGLPAKSVQQAKRNLQVRCDETVYYAYLPNGHIAKDKKAIGTKYGVYWTGKPRTKIESTNEISINTLLPGSFGDFDDKNCGETLDNHKRPSGRAGDGVPCIGKFKIPHNTPPGIYNAVWYWEFWLSDEDEYVDQDQARGYSGASYHSCFQFEVLSDKRNSERQKSLYFDDNAPNVENVTAPVVPPDLDSFPKPQIRRTPPVVIPVLDNHKPMSPLQRQNAPISNSNKGYPPESSILRPTSVHEITIVADVSPLRSAESISPDNASPNKMTESLSLPQVNHGSC